MKFKGLPSRFRPIASISSMKIIEGDFFLAIIYNINKWVSILAQLKRVRVPASKSARTREDPTPTYICTKSLPEIKKKGTPDSPAQACSQIRRSNLLGLFFNWNKWAIIAVTFARRVLPVPGGPVSNAPFGIFAPRPSYFEGFFKKSTNSMISYLASYWPATSLNITRTFASI